MLLPCVIAIEGAIGSGKSTQLELLRQRDHVCFSEPVEKWTNFNGRDLLKNFYEDNTLKSALELQWYITTTLKERALEIEQALKSYSIVFVERSFRSSLGVFISIMDDTYGPHAEIEDIKKFILDLVNEHEKDYHSILLKVSPNVAYNRSTIRQRQGEDTMTPTYNKLVTNKVNAMTYHKTIDCDDLNSAEVVAIILNYIKQ